MAVAQSIAHGLSHVTYNRIFHRFATFAMSNVVLSGPWGLPGLEIAGQHAA